MRFIHQVTFGAIAALGLALSAGCSTSTSTGGSEEELSAEQCTYFAVGDKVQVCHRTGSARNPYNIIRTSSAGCASGHSGHAGDYVTSTDPASPIYDPTCNGLGCIPLGAPVDGSVECCEFLAPSGGVCADIDECATNNGDCGSGYACTNNIEAPPTCTEIDECADGTDNCDANAACANTPGSFTCTCNPGYFGDGVTCTDIDECLAGTDNCDANATCANTPGSFTCTCDDGYHGDGVTCNTVCGDGIRAGGEQCDDGNNISGDGCSASCTIEVCGDGIVSGAEQCDDGNNISGDGCSASCTIEVCGDGLIQPPEQCDLGGQNGVPGSGCQANCTVEQQINLSVRIHEHCDPNSVSIEFTEDTANLNWPGHLNQPSYVTLAANTDVTVFSGFNFTGQQRTFTVNTNFCGLTYPNGEVINDNVRSIHLFLAP